MTSAPVTPVPGDYSIWFESNLFFLTPKTGECREFCEGIIAPDVPKWGNAWALHPGQVEALVRTLEDAGFTSETE